MKSDAVNQVTPGDVMSEGSRQENIYVDLEVPALWMTVAYVLNETEPLVRDPKAYEFDIYAGSSTRIEAMK